MLTAIAISVVILSVVRLNVVMLTAIALSVIILSVVRQNVVMLSVAAPWGEASLSFLRRRSFFRRKIAFGPT